MRIVARALVCLAAGLAAALVVAQPPEADRPITPGDVIQACAADLVRVDPERVKSTRWVSLHNAPPKDRETLAKVISGHLNSLSREPDIVVPAKVSEWLLRIDALDYGKVFAEQWERLGAVEPYWHGEDLQPVEEYETRAVEYGYWATEGGQTYTGKRRAAGDRWTTTRTETERVRKAAKVVRGFGPWVVREPTAKAAFELIQARTGGTDAPVVTGEWLLYQTAISFERKPGYYDLLGVKDLKTYEQAVGVVRKDIDAAFLKELREAVGSSTVTTPDTLRRVVRLEKVAGGYWFTQDANQRQAKDAARGNPITELGDDYQFQAVETFAHLPNGLWATGLFDAAGVRQDKAPDAIASDSTAPHTDRAVHVNLSCIRCHTEGGLQEVDGWVRNVLNAPPNFVVTTDPKKAHDLRQQYVTRRIEPHLKADRDRYAAALWEATGMKPAEYAKAYAAVWEECAERPVTAERAARDLGCSVEELQKALADLGPKIDPVLSAFRLPKPRTVPVVLWLRSYARAQDARYGVSRPFKVREEKK